MTDTEIDESLDWLIERLEQARKKAKKVLKKKIRVGSFPGHKLAIFYFANKEESQKKQDQSQTGLMFFDIFY